MIHVNSLYSISIGQCLPNIYGYSDIGGFSGINSSPSGALQTITLNANVTFRTERSANVNIETFDFSASRVSNTYQNTNDVRPSSRSTLFLIKY